MSNTGNQLVSNIFKALSHPARLQIIKQLVDGSLCVCEILPRVEIEQSNASQHLSVLKSQGILSSRKEGAMVFYEIKRPEVLEIIQLAEHMIVTELEETKSLVERSF